MVKIHFSNFSYVFIWKFRAEILMSFEFSIARKWYKFDERTFDRKIVLMLKNNKPSKSHVYRKLRQFGFFFEVALKIKRNYFLLFNDKTIDTWGTEQIKTSLELEMQQERRIKIKRNKPLYEQNHLVYMIISNLIFMHWVLGKLAIWYNP